jgi:hypothetical protein
MAVIPRFLLQHRVDVEPFTGHSAKGPTYGTKVANVPCFVQNGQRLTRGQNAEQVTASATVRFRPDVVCPVGSRITFAGGRTAIVLVANQQDGGRLAVPSHLEVMTT